MAQLDKLITDLHDSLARDLDRGGETVTRMSQNEFTESNTSTESPIIVDLEDGHKRVVIDAEEGLALLREIRGVKGGRPIPFGVVGKDKEEVWWVLVEVGRAVDGKDTLHLVSGLTVESGCGRVAELAGMGGNRLVVFDDVARRQVSQGFPMYLDTMTCMAIFAKDAYLEAAHRLKWVQMSKDNIDLLYRDRAQYVPNAQALQDSLGSPRTRPTKHPSLAGIAACPTNDPAIGKLLQSTARDQSHNGLLPWPRLRDIPYEFKKAYERCVRTPAPQETNYGGEQQMALRLLTSMPELMAKLPEDHVAKRILSTPDNVKTADLEEFGDLLGSGSFDETLAALLKMGGAHPAEMGSVALTTWTHHLRPDVVLKCEVKVLDKLSGSVRDNKLHLDADVNENAPEGFFQTYLDQVFRSRRLLGLSRYVRVDVSVKPLKHDNHHTGKTPPSIVTTLGNTSLANSDGTSTAASEASSLLPLQRSQSPVQGTTSSEEAASGNNSPADGVGALTDATGALSSGPPSGPPQPPPPPPVRSEDRDVADSSNIPPQSQSQSPSDNHPGTPQSEPTAHPRDADPSDSATHVSGVPKDPNYQELLEQQQHLLNGVNEMVKWSDKEIPGSQDLWLQQVKELQMRAKELVEWQRHKIADPRLQNLQRSRGMGRLAALLEWEQALQDLYERRQQHLSGPEVQEYHHELDYTAKWQQEKLQNWQETQAIFRAMVSESGSRIIVESPVDVSTPNSTSGRAPELGSGSPRPSANPSLTSSEGTSSPSHSHVQPTNVDNVEEPGSSQDRTGVAPPAISTATHPDGTESGTSSPPPHSGLVAAQQPQRQQVQPPPAIPASSPRGSASADAPAPIDEGQAVRQQQQQRQQQQILMDRQRELLKVVEIQQQGEAVPQSEGSDRLPPGLLEQQKAWRKQVQEMAEWQQNTKNGELSSGLQQGWARRLQELTSWRHQLDDLRVRWVTGAGSQEPDRQRWEQDVEELKTLRDENLEDWQQWTQDLSQNISADRAWRESPSVQPTHDVDAYRMPTNALADNSAQAQTEASPDVAEEQQMREERVQTTAARVSSAAVTSATENLEAPDASPTEELEAPNPTPTATSTGSPSIVAGTPALALSMPPRGSPTQGSITTTPKQGSHNAPSVTTDAAASSESPVAPRTPSPGPAHPSTPAAGPSGYGSIVNQENAHHNAVTRQLLVDNEFHPGEDWESSFQIPNDRVAASAATSSAKGLESSVADPSFDPPVEEQATPPGSAEPESDPLDSTAGPSGNPGVENQEDAPVSILDEQQQLLDHVNSIVAWEHNQPDYANGVENVLLQQQEALQTQLKDLVEWCGVGADSVQDPHLKELQQKMCKDRLTIIGDWQKGLDHLNDEWEHLPPDLQQEWQHWQRQLFDLTQMQEANWENWQELQKWFKEKEKEFEDTDEVFAHHDDAAAAAAATMEQLLTEKMELETRQLEIEREQQTADKMYLIDDAKVERQRRAWWKGFHAIKKLLLDVHHADVLSLWQQQLSVCGAQLEIVSKWQGKLLALMKRVGRANGNEKDPNRREGLRVDPKELQTGLRELEALRQQQDRRWKQDLQDLERTEQRLSDHRQPADGSIGADSNTSKTTGGAPRRYDSDVIWDLLASGQTVECSGLKYVFHIGVAHGRITRAKVFPKRDGMVIKDEFLEAVRDQETITLLFRLDPAECTSLDTTRV